MTEKNAADWAAADFSVFSLPGPKMLSIARKAYAVSVIINCKVARATYRAAEKIVEPYDEAGVFAPMFFGAQVGFDVAEGMARGVFHGDISITDFLVHGPRLAHERAIALMN